MENLWSGTDSGLSKDWDDDFDDIETPITYDFPYAELASQSVVAPILNPPKKNSSKNQPKSSDVGKDGNILQAKKTYSKKRKNPLFFESEISPRKVQKKNDPTSQIQKTNTSTSTQLEKSVDSGVSFLNHSKDDCPKESGVMSVALNDFNTEMVNGIKTSHNEVDRFEYSLFSDIDGCLDQPEENPIKSEEELGILSNESPKTGYQRTRKNMKQKLNNQVQQSVESIGSVVSVISNSIPPPVDSKSVLKTKREKRGSRDSNNSASGSDKHEFLDFPPPPPKKELSLMDMVKKYTEEVQNSQSRCDNTKKKKNPTKKSQKPKTSKASRLSEDEEYFPKGKVPHTLNKNLKEPPNEYVQDVYPVTQLPSKRSIGQSKKNTVKKEKAPPQKRQPRTRRVKSVQSAETEDKLDTSLSIKRAQSVESNSFVSHVNSNSPTSQASTQAVFNSSICNSRIIENVSASQKKNTKNLNHLSAKFQCSETAFGTELSSLNVQTLPTSENNSNHPVAPVLHPTKGFSSRKKLNLSVQGITEQLTVEHTYQATDGPHSVNPSTSMHCDQSDLSDSGSETSVVNHRTFSLLGADFFCHMCSVINSISKSCAIQCLEDAEDWIAETPYSRELTVKEFCNNPLVMNVLLEFFNGNPDFEKLLKLENSTKVIYEFPEDFQNVPIYRMLKDYVDQVLQQMVPPNISPAVLSFSSRSVLEFAFNKMPFRECAIMSLLFSKVTEVLKYADVAAKLNFVALLVIFDEFRQREIES